MPELHNYDALLILITEAITLEETSVILRADWSEVFATSQPSAKKALNSSFE